MNDTDDEIIEIKRKNTYYYSPNPTNNSISLK